MSQQQHTQEPWRANDAQADIDGPNGEPVAVCYCNDESGDDAKENARRIVACVNACAGIPTDALEREPYLSTASYMIRQDAMKQRDDALAQRDTLLAAAEAVVERWDSPLWKDLPNTGEYINRLRAAIASVKGGAA